MEKTILFSKLAFCACHKKAIQITHKIQFISEQQGYGSWYRINIKQLFEVDILNSDNVLV